jgi:hypothetical protein
MRPELILLQVKATEFVKPMACLYTDCGCRDINKTTLLLSFEVTSDLQGDHTWHVTAL